MVYRIELFEDQDETDEYDLGLTGLLGMPQSMFTSPMSTITIRIVSTIASPARPETDGLCKSSLPRDTVSRAFARCSLLNSSLHEEQT